MCIRSRRDIGGTRAHALYAYIYACICIFLGKNSDAGVGGLEKIAGESFQHNKLKESKKSIQRSLDNQKQAFLSSIYDQKTSKAVLL
jgi:hypothetical protein